MTAQQLKNSILQMAVQGKLVPQDPNDEPASALLERIRAEKAQLTKEGKIKRDKNESVILRKTDENGERAFFERMADGTERDITGEIPFDVPETWEWVRLRNYLDVRDGTHDTPKYVPNGVPLITSKNLRQGVLDFENVKFISHEDHLTISQRSNVDDGDILFAMIGSIGNPVIVKKTREFSIKNIALFKPIFHRCTNMKYVYYFFLFAQIMLNREAGGGVQAFVSLKHFRNFLFPLPPHGEQNRVVDLLEKLISYIESYGIVEKKLTTLNTVFPTQLKKSILQAAVQGKLVPQNLTDEPATALLERIRSERDQLIRKDKLKPAKNESHIFKRDKSYYEARNGAEVCVDDELPFEIPDSWAWVRLETLSANIHYGFTASAAISGNAKLLRITDIQENVVHWDSVPFCDPTEREFSVYGINNRDIMIARTGGTIGKSYIVRNLSERAVFASYLIRVIPLSCVNEEYLKIFLETPLYWVQLKKSSMGTGQPNVNGKSLKSLILPLPPLTEQHRIVEKAQALLACAENM